MQFVDGVNLRSAIGIHGMAFGRVAPIIRQIGSALSAAHEKGVYHRDLKPANIMLQTLADGEEHVKLIDFGIATVTKAGGDSTRTERIVIPRSRDYMRPEPLLGER